MARAIRGERERGAVGDRVAPEQLTQMLFDAPGRDAKAHRDLLVRVSGRDQAEDLALSFGRELRHGPIVLVRAVRHMTRTDQSRRANPRVAPAVPRVKR
jgi:hypothetical protein